MLLDTASLYFRAYFGVPETVRAPDGTPVNAVRGLLDFIALLVRTHSPDSLVAWDAVAALRGTLVLLMAVDNTPEIAEVLLAGGRSAGTPVAVVVDGTMPTERTVLSTLGALADDLAAHEVRPPAIIVVGDVVAVARPAHYGRG